MDFIIDEKKRKGIQSTQRTKEGYDMKITEQTRWIPVSERLPEDGTWNIWQSKTGELSVERYKADAMDHFYPPGRFFQLEDAIAWMPLPKRYEAGSEKVEE